MCGISTLPCLIMQRSCWFSTRLLSGMATCTVHAEIQLCDGEVKQLPYKKLSRNFLKAIKFEVDTNK